MTQEFINDLADKLQKVGTLHAIGETWISIDSTIPAGGVPFLGQIVNRSVWADLFAWATAQGKVKSDSEWQTYASAHGGNCPFYSDGDGSTTFRMPRIKSYLKGADTILDAGGYTAEGVPNITGSFSASTYGVSCTDAFALVAGSKVDCPNGNNGGGKTFTFDASRSNAIYGNSSHVTPETNSILVGVYAVGIVANIGSADATQFLNGLATLEANTNAHIRVVKTWKSSDGLNWYRKWSDGWIEQGGSIEFSKTASVSLNTPFSSANYFAQVCNMEDGIANEYQYSICFSSKTTTGFEIARYNSVNNANNWYACGY